MFEIIMLLAFWYAATSQFFPDRPMTTRARPRKKKASFVKTKCAPRGASKGHAAKRKSRGHEYARAA